jgi:hypothetical protein
MKQITAKINNTQLLIIISLIIVLLFLIWYKTSYVDMDSNIDSNIDLNIENFDNSSVPDNQPDVDLDPSTLDLVQLPDGYYNSSMYIDPTLNQTTNISQRPCSVYYVSDPNKNINDTLCALCDQGFFDNPPVTMQVRQAILDGKRSSGTMTAAEQTERNYIDWYNWIKPKLPNGACKVSFDDWVEPTKTPDNQIYPIKNQNNAKDVTRGQPQDWAFCFKPVNAAAGESASSKATLMSQQFADEKAVLSTNGVFQPFNNGDQYARVAFKTFVLDDFIRDAKKIRNQPDGTDLNNFICKAGNLPPANDLPPDGSFLELVLDSTNTIKSLMPTLYNLTTQSIKPITGAQTLYNIYKQFFTIQQRGNVVYIVPNRFNSLIYKLQLDICNRVKKVVSKTQFVLSLVSSMGLNAQSLYQSLGPDDITYGDIPTLQARITTLQSQQSQVQQQIDAYIASPPPVAQANTQGLTVKTYDLLQFSWGYTVTDMDDIFTNSRRSKYNRTEITTKPNYYANQAGRQDAYFGKLYEGYIKAPETGTYRFIINSDDGGDLMINNQLLSAHYGGHWVDFGGKQIIPITLTAGQYYQFRARYVQWEGGAGIQLYWLLPSRSSMNYATCTAPVISPNYLPQMPAIYKCYQEIPASAYFYYSNSDQITKDAQQQTNIKARDQLIQQQQQIQTTITTINNAFTSQVNSMIARIPGLKFTGIDFAKISSNGKFYIYIGQFDSTLTSTSESINLQVVPLYQPTINICTKQLVYDSPINQSQLTSGQVQYSVAFWVRIDDKSGNWRTILFHGKDDNHGGTASSDDRTPGIWIQPNSTALHFSHKSTTQNNPWTNINFNPGTSIWYHFVAVVNNNSTDFYVNGNKIQTSTLSGTNNVYVWGNQDKKLYINNTPVWGGKCTTSVLLNNLMWYNYPITMNEITPLFAQKPFSLTITDLLANASTSGVYTLMKNGNEVSMYIYIDPAGKKWILILLYNHKGGTNPILNPIKTGNFPIPIDNNINNMPIGRDESGTAAWGHVAPSYLAQFSISEMAFWASGGSKNKTINFRTTDQSVINYATSGQGYMRPGFPTTTGSIFTNPQTSSIPKDAPAYFANQGDYALTEFPFWKGAQAHWGIRGLGNRWEIDDYPNNNNYNTLHMVFIA